jgi:hypothetical protein
MLDTWNVGLDEGGKSTMLALPSLKPEGQDQFNVSRAEILFSAPPGLFVVLRIGCISICLQTTHCKVFLRGPHYFPASYLVPLKLLQNLRRVFEIVHLDSWGDFPLLRKLEELLHLRICASR